MTCLCDASFSIQGILNVDGGSCSKGNVCFLDNRHISGLLKETLCDPSPVEIDPAFIEVAKEHGVDATAGGLR
jgi:hypothetical protein